MSRIYLLVIFFYFINNSWAKEKPFSDTIIESLLAQSKYEKVITLVNKNIAKTRSTDYEKKIYYLNKKGLQNLEKETSREHSILVKIQGF